MPGERARLRFEIQIGTSCVGHLPPWVSRWSSSECNCHYARKVSPVSAWHRVRTPAENSLTLHVWARFMHQMSFRQYIYMYRVLLYILAFSTDDKIKGIMTVHAGKYNMTKCSVKWCIVTMNTKWQKYWPNRVDFWPCAGKMFYAKSPWCVIV